jgi:hypothetical protein
MNNFTERVGKSLGRHFVSLSCVQHPQGSEEMQVHVFSGFVMDVAGEWFYVTAGHILRDIRIALEAGSTFDIWRFGDQTAGNKFKDTAVPYGFKLDDWFVLEDERSGLDYAIVHIGGLYRQQLEAGGISALGKSAWSDNVAEHDHWALVGIPKETVVYDGKTVISARFVMTPLLQTDEVPQFANQRAENQFYAKLADDTESMVADIVGMSGGPVFRLKNTDGTWKYNVIGVQSGWYPSTRILAICPFSSFALAIESVVQEELHAEDVSSGHKAQNHE